MRTPATAMLWELWRLTRRGMAIQVSMSVLLGLSVLTLAGFYGAQDTAATLLVTVAPPSLNEWREWPGHVRRRAGGSSVQMNFLVIAGVVKCVARKGEKMTSRSPLHGLLVSAALVIGFCAGPVASVAAQPTLDERLARLAEEIERNRVELHAPGAALVVVQGDEVVFARGFGLADLEHETPVTPDTRFFIGSSTKAFTATLLGMLVDEGVMDWDDPVEQHLPYFTLPVESDRDARAAIRDLLSHRTGFARMNMLWVGGALTPEEILRQAVQAEPFAPFRERWYYNNVMYLAAGWAGAAAAGAPWDELVTERILVPLGMTDTQTSIRDARGGPRMARGYTWNEDLEEFRLHVPSGDGVGVDPIAPAGSISSSVLDMAKWLRFLLANGVVDGQRLISEEALTETWTRQIRIGGGVGYGLGWMLRDWQGQRLIEHGGNVPGFSAQVAILPESDLGFVLLTNANASVLAPLAITVVPSALLGEWADPDPADEIDDFRPYVGRYVANFATFSNEIFTVVERNGHLALDIPSQRVYDLNPPDAEGRWQFTLTDQISVSFERDDAGAVVALTMRQSGMVFEVLREGIEVEPEIDLDELRKHLGPYRAEQGDFSITLVIENQRLAFRGPGGVETYDLHPPDDNGRWVARANAGLTIAFDEADTGVVVGLDFKRPGRPALSLRAAGGNDTPLPSVDELLALRVTTAGGSGAVEVENYRASGTVRFPQAAVDGRFETTVAGDDRQRVEIDMGRFGQIRVSQDGDRAWRDTSFDMEPFDELRGTMLQQVRREHPAVLFGDWRASFDAATVVRTGDIDGRQIYVVRLETEDLPAIRLSVEAETGDVLRVERTLVIPGIGGMPVVDTYEDYRNVHGMRIPYRTIESNEATGRTIFEVESVEINVDLDEDAFILRPRDDR